MAAGVLPPADRQLVMFEQWLARWLEQLSDPAQHKILQTYATWSVLRRLRESAEDGPLGPYREQAARCGLRAAAAFLDELASHGDDLAGCRQADLDRWLATASDSAKKTLWPFFTWAIRTRRMPRLSLPPLHREIPKLISLRERVELLRRIRVRQFALKTRVMEPGEFVDTRPPRRAAPARDSKKPDWKKPDGAKPAWKTKRP